MGLTGCFILANSCLVFSANACVLTTNSLQEVKLFDADEIKQIERNIGQQRCKNYRVIVIYSKASVACQRNTFLQN